MHSKRKLSKKDIIDIREAKDFYHKELAYIFGVSCTTIQRIRNNVIYKEIQWVKPINKKLVRKKGNLSKEDVLYIRKSGISGVKLAKQFNLSNKTISRIKNKEVYAWVM